MQWRSSEHERINDLGGRPEALSWVYPGTGYQFLGFELFFD